MDRLTDNELRPARRSRGRSNRLTKGATAAPESRPESEQMATKDAAEHIGLSYRTLEKWRNTGEQELPHRKIGCRVYYAKSDLDAWLKSTKRTHTQ